MYRTSVFRLVFFLYTVQVFNQTHLSNVLRLGRNIYIFTFINIVH